METNEALADTVEAILVAANTAIDNKEWSSANLLLTRGLDALGYRYSRAGTVDDSGQKLAAAGFQDAKGAAESAAGIRRAVLTSRLALLRQKIASEPGGPHEPRR